jgi:hypothetical protein
MMNMALIGCMLEAIKDGDADWAFYYARVCAHMAYLHLGRS